MQIESRECHWSWKDVYGFNSWTLQPRKLRKNNQWVIKEDTRRYYPVSQVKIVFQGRSSLLGQCVQMYQILLIAWVGSYFWKFFLNFLIWWVPCKREARAIFWASRMLCLGSLNLNFNAANKSRQLQVILNAEFLISLSPDPAALGQTASCNYRVSVWYHV